MAEEKKSIFREETLAKISSPDQLTDYLRVTNPGIWVVFVSILVLLLGVVVWASVGTLETTSDAVVIVEDHSAVVVIGDSNILTSGMKLRISSDEYVIAATNEDDYGRVVGFTEVSLPDGTYEGKVVTDKTHPISFLTESW